MQQGHHHSQAELHLLVDVQVDGQLHVGEARQALGLGQGAGEAVQQHALLPPSLAALQPLLHQLRHMRVACQGVCLGCQTTSCPLCGLRRLLHAPWRMPRHAMPSTIGRAAARHAELACPAQYLPAQEQHVDMVKAAAQACFRGTAAEN